MNNRHRPWTRFKGGRGVVFNNFKTVSLVRYSDLNTRDVERTRENCSKPRRVAEKRMAAVGFEPTPLSRLVPKTSALDTRPRYQMDVNQYRQ